MYQKEQNKNQNKFKNTSVESHALLTIGEISQKALQNFER